MPGSSPSATPNGRRRLPWWTALALIGTFIYDISPLDLIPEGFFGPFGFADDAALTTVVLAWIARAYFGSAKKGATSTSLTVEGTATRDAD